jgi:hypothetical protein
VRGIEEDEASWIARLVGAGEAWGVAGTPAAVLRQVHALLAGWEAFSPEWPLAALISVGATACRWDWIRTGPGSEPESYVAGTNIDIEGAGPPWRQYLAIYCHPENVGSGASASVASIGGTSVSGVTSGFAVVTGISGVMPEVGDWLYLAAPAVSEGNYQVVEILSSTSVRIAAPLLSAPEAGPIAWALNRYTSIRPGLPYGSPGLVIGSGAIGLAGRTDVIESLRTVARRWKSARCWISEIVFVFEGGSFAPGQQFCPWSGAGTGNPNGGLERWGQNVDGVWTARSFGGSPGIVFVEGTGRYRDCSVVNDG